MSRSYEAALRYDESKKWAALENKGGGVLRVEIQGCDNIPVADKNGVSDPYIRILFSNVPENQQEAETPSLSDTLNPRWKSKNRFQFNTVQDTDEVVYELFDKNVSLISKSGRILARCKVVIGRGSELGSHEQTSVLHFHHPDSPDTLQHIDGQKAPSGDSYGTLTVHWSYSFSTTGNLFASIDPEPYQYEDFSTTRFNNEIGRISNHLYYMMVPYWYWDSTCRWERPFETAFWLLFLYCAVFVFDNVLSAFFPGIMFVSFVRTYWIRQRYGLDGPKEEAAKSVGLLQALKDTKQMLHNTQINCKWTSDLLDWWYEIYTWKKQDTAAALTKFFFFWTLAVLFLPIPKFRYWLFAFMVYMYTLYPLYCYFPNIYRQYHEVALVGIISEAVGSVFNLRNCEKYIWPWLPAALVNLIPPSQARLLEQKVTEDSQLPKIPDYPMSYSEWKRFHEKYEERKRMLALQMKAEMSSPRSKELLKIDTTTGLIDMPKTQMELEKMRGKLWVKVMSATNLQGRDASGLCDPYVVLKSLVRRDPVPDSGDMPKTIGQEERTSECKQTQRPVWNTTFTLHDLNHCSGMLVVAVRDKNIGKDDLSLGVGAVDLSRLAIMREEKVSVEMHGVEGFAGKGRRSLPQVVLMLRGENNPHKEGEDGWPTAEQVELLRAERERREKARKAMRRPQPDTRTGGIFVTVLYGCALKVCDRNSSDPYVTLSHRGELRETDVRKSSINPVWNERFYFQNVSSASELALRCADHDKFGKHDEMGRGEVRIGDIDLYEGENKEHSVPMMLRGEQFGSIRLLLRATGFGLVDPPPARPVPPPPPPAGAWSPAGSPARPRPAPPAPGGADAFATPAYGTPQPTAGGYAQPEPAYGSAQPAAPGGGRLSVTVLQARGLVPLPSNPHPEPYVKFRLHAAAGSGQKFKTRPCAAGTTEPVWNVKFTFSGLPRDALHTQRLQIEVWDARATSEALAAGICNLDIVAEHGESLDSWVTVFHGPPGQEVPAGEVHLVLTPEGLE